MKYTVGQHGLEVLFIVWHVNVTERRKCGGKGLGGKGGAEHVKCG